MQAHLRRWSVDAMPAALLRRGEPERGTVLLKLNQIAAGCRILLPRAKEARDILPRTLESAGARVDILPCYENVLPEVDEAMVRGIVREPPEIVVFTSSSTVTNFAKILGGNNLKSVFERSTVAALGPITAGTIESLGKRVAILPKENTTASLLQALASHYRGE